MMDSKMTMVKAAVANEGYFFDMETLTLYMSTAWEKKSNQIGSEACEVRDQIENLFPNVKTETIARKRKNTAVTYDMMRAFISIMPDADKKLAEMDRQIAMSKVFKSSYKHVTEWFEKEYPFYGQFVVEGKDGAQGWNAVELYKKAMEQQKAKTQAEEADSNIVPIAG